MTRSIAQRIGMAALGVALVLAVGELGDRYFRGFETEYGWDVNVFGPNEGAFFLLYTVLGCFAVALFSYAGGGSIRGAFSRLGSARVEPGRIAAFLAVGAFLAALFFRFVVFLESPMTDDENAYTFAARILARGKLALPGYPESLRPFLTNQFLVVEDRVFTQYYPGFPLVLALPVALGIEWIVNPLAAALGIAGTYLLGRDLSGDRWTGVLAAGLLFLSPSYLLTAGTLFSHPVAAAWAAWGLWAAWRARQGGRARFALLAATCLGMLLWTRPLSGAICGAVGAWMLLSSAQPLRRKLVVAAPAAAVGLLFCAGILLCHALTTGDPFVSGYDYYAEYSRIANSSFRGDQLTSGGWLVLLALPLLRFDNWMLGWPLSFLLLPFAPRGPVRAFGLLVVFGIWFAHLPWTVTGVNLTGAAHYFETMPMLAVLSAAGARALLRREDRAQSDFAFNAILASAFLSLTVFYPWATGNLHRLARYNLTPYVAVESRVQPPAIVFGTYARNLFDMQQRRNGTWTFFRKNNSVDLDDAVLWFNDLGPRNAVAMRMFPGRRYYRLASESNAIGQTRLNVVEITEAGLAREERDRKPVAEGGARTPATDAGPLPDAGPAGEEER